MSFPIIRIKATDISRPVGVAGSAGSHGSAGPNGIRTGGNPGTAAGMLDYPWSTKVKFTRVLIPKICCVTNKKLWLVKAYQVKFIYANKHWGTKWYCKDAYIIAALRDEIVHPFEIVEFK